MILLHVSSHFQAPIETRVLFGTLSSMVEGKSKQSCGNMHWFLKFLLISTLAKASETVDPNINQGNASLVAMDKGV